MLKLTESNVQTCPECKGLGTVPCPPTIATRSGIHGSNAGGPIFQPSSDKPIPCPQCKGKKVVP